MKTTRIIIALLSLLVSSVCAFTSAAAPRNDSNGAVQRAERIKSNKAYYNGTGYGITLDEAKRTAVEDLDRKSVV